jgi:hypothetical protein
LIVELSEVPKITEQVVVIGNVNELILSWDNVPGARRCDLLVPVKIRGVWLGVEFILREDVEPFSFWASELDEIRAIIFDSCSLPS